MADSPPNCEHCHNAPATQVFSADVFNLGRHTVFCCPACGDEQEFHVRRLDGKSPVWRYAIAPIKEKTDA